MPSFATPMPGNMVPSGDAGQLGDEVPERNPTGAGSSDAELPSVNRSTVDNRQPSLVARR